MKMKVSAKRLRALNEKILFTLTGAAAGLLESVFTAPFLCLFAMLPIFTLLGMKSRRKLAVKILPFLAAYDLVKTSFLLEIYDIVGSFVLIGLLAAAAAAIIAAALLLTVQIFCLSFYCPVAKDGIIGAVMLSLLFSSSEWLCGKLGVLSFPWLGVWAQADGAYPVLMTANLFGSSFTSFLILLGCGIVWIIITQIRQKNRIKAVRTAAGLTALCAAVMIYGSVSASSLKEKAEKSESVSVLAVQLDCEGEEKSSMSALQSSAGYMELINEYYSGESFVFLPETAINTVYEQDKEAFCELERFCAENGCTALTGCFFIEDGKKYNSIVMITPEDAKAVHYKSHLIPFGEYLPFSWLRDSDSLYGYSGVCEPADSGGVKIACGICIESIYPEIFRSQVNQGARLIFISTNDSWFGDSSARSAHYLESKMRAIENSRYAVRAGNCGISAVITPWGEEEAIEISGEKSALSAGVRLISDRSLYSAAGNLILLPSLALFIMSAAADAEKKLSALRTMKHK